MFTGFARYASIPAARQRSSSPFIAFAVTATIGVRACEPPCLASAARIWRESSCPSMRGMWMSASTAA
jgi:hypothetical protein